MPKVNLYSWYWTQVQSWFSGCFGDVLTTTLFCRKTVTAIDASVPSFTRSDSTMEPVRRRNCIYVAIGPDLWAFDRHAAQYRRVGYSGCAMGTFLVLWKGSGQTVKHNLFAEEFSVATATMPWSSTKNSRKLAVTVTSSSSWPRCLPLTSSMSTVYWNVLQRWMMPLALVP